MSEQVQFVVELDINDPAKFREIAAACIAAVEAAEATTLAYLWNLSEDGKKCCILEWYANSAAIPPHLALVGPMLKEMEGVAEVTSFKVLGKVEGEAKEALAAMGAPIYGYWAGFSRCGG